MNALIDLTGQRFGCVVVLEKSTPPNKRDARWICLCDCGGRLTIVGASLRNKGGPKTCRCYRGGHGLTSNGQVPTGYSAWSVMKQRCENPNNPKYYRYGARGIKVCERWRRSFEVFSKDMGPRPEGHSIERRDNDGNYEPSNCVWATRKAQQRNRCTNKFVEYLGNKMTLFEAVEISKTIIPYETIYFRLRQGWELSQALTRPLNPNGRPRKAIRKRDRVS